jgi:putative ABC transport system permease protein
MTLRLAFRTLFKTPFVTTVAIVSLALGIGANTAIYSVFDQILRRPLTVPEPERLVNFEAPPPKPGNTSCNQAGSCDVVFSYRCSAISSESRPYLQASPPISCSAPTWRLVDRR